MRDDFLEQGDAFVIGVGEDVEDIHVPAFRRVESYSEHEPPAVGVDRLFAVHEGEALSEFDQLFGEPRTDFRGRTVSQFVTSDMGHGRS